MQTFDLALGLRMVRPAVDRADAQADEPLVQLTDTAPGLVPRGEGTVAEQRLGKAIFAE